MNNPAGQNLLTGGAGSFGDAIGSVVKTGLKSVVTGGGFSPTSFLNDPRDIYLLAESCAIPGRNFDMYTRRTGMKSVKIPYGLATDDTVKFTFLLTNDYYILKYFKSWMDLIVPPSDNLDELRVNYKNVYSTDIQIQQMSEGDFIPAYSVKLMNAFPTAIDTITLSNTSDDIVRCTVSVTYDNWEEEGLMDGMIGTASNLIGNII
jgi:hypothetical protein